MDQQSSRKRSHDDTSPSRPGKMAKKQQQNGSPVAHQHANGAAPATAAHAEQRIGPREQIRRGEYIRLLEQSLVELGYVHVARSLEKASGIACQAPEVASLKDALAAGKWDLAVSLLDRLPLQQDAGMRHAKFLILEQKYLEALAAQDTQAALQCLRKELGPLKADTQRLHELANCMMCLEEGELRERAGWAGPGPGSRAALLTALQARARLHDGWLLLADSAVPRWRGSDSFVPPDVLLPAHRLETLVEQAMELQLLRCVYHNAHAPAISLLADYACGPEQIPSVTVEVRHDHLDEVWQIAFSHNGAMLASASRDNTACIYRVQRWRLEIAHTLRGHTDAIACLAWSPDDSMLATCGHDRTVRLWSSRDGQSLKELTHHTNQVSAVAWLPDSKRLVTGSHDKSMILSGIDGLNIKRWKTAHVHDLAVSSDGRLLFCVTSEDKVRVYDLRTHLEVPQLCISEAASIISLSLAADGRRLLLNLANQCIHLWELAEDWEAQDTPAQPAISQVMSYEAGSSRTGRYVVRSCLGGYNSSFVLAGSEENKVFVWHRATGDRPLAALQGHEGTVNSVSWNPVDHQMFASAGDDCTVRIWGPPQAGAGAPALQNGHAAS